MLRMLSLATLWCASAMLAAAAEPAAAGATLKGDQWTPAKDAAGNIAQAEWDGLPLDRWIEWTGTALESQLKPPYGAAEGFKAPGNGPTSAHYNAYTGAGWDEKSGRFYHFGGGHADGGNNMLTCFDVARGAHSVVIPPTHQNMMPDKYKVPPGNQNLSGVWYPSGKAYNYFPSAETPAGDDAPCASHEWAGIVFIPGINEVLLPRFGWFHAMLDSKKWRAGPQTAEANRVGFKNRGGIFFNCHYLPQTGLVYMTSEGGQISDNNGYYNIVKYDPVKRQEVGTIGFDAACGGCDSVVDQNSLLWFWNGDGEGQGQKVTISTVDLPKGASVRKRTPCTGRRPYFDDGDNPAQYVPDLDKILMWCTRGRKDEAQSGEMLEFDRTKLAFSPFTVEGKAPKPPANMNNKMRYWPKQKVLVFQLATDVNARIIKLAK
jgi:hypothetical protein